MAKRFIFGAPYRFRLTNGQSFEGTVIKIDEQTIHLEIKSREETIDLKTVEDAAMLSFGPGE